MIKGYYKVAIKQADTLFFLSYSVAMSGHFLTRMEKYASWFPSSSDSVQALRNYCLKTFKGNMSQVPMVVIKLIDRPLKKIN